MINVLDSGSSDPGSSPEQGHVVRKVYFREKWSTKTTDELDSVKCLITPNSISVTRRVVFNVKDVFFSL